MRKPKRKTLLLNADHIPITIVGWQKAVTMIYLGKAKQIDFYTDDKLRDGKGRSYDVPAVIILSKYIHRNYKRAKLTKGNVLARDKFTCQYCLGSFRPSELTIDHVIPRSKWKSKEPCTNWKNVVAACHKCNRLKGDSTDIFPANWGVWGAKPPSYDEVFFGLQFGGRIEKEWLKWLSVFQSYKEVVEWAT